MGIATIILALFIGKVAITPDNYARFLAGMRVAFFIFAVLCIAGIAFSLIRGQVNGSTPHNNEHSADEKGSLKPIDTITSENRSIKIPWKSIGFDKASRESTRCGNTAQGFSGSPQKYADSLWIPVIRMEKRSEIRIPGSARRISRVDKKNQVNFFRMPPSDSH